MERPAGCATARDRALHENRGLPPDNVKLLGRWHAIGEFRGVAIVEATDTGALAAWVLQWGDVFSFDVAPALSDEELGAALTAFQGASK
jgi:hypothetical protein